MSNHMTDQAIACIADILNSLAAKLIGTSSTDERRAIMRDLAYYTHYHCQLIETISVNKLTR